jgi:ABC-type lipopolysaccharide export system ATPase subunit
MNNKMINFTYNDINIVFNKNSIVTILGNSNKSILHFLENKYKPIIYENLINDNSDIKVYDKVLKYAKTNKKAQEYISKFNLSHCEKELIRSLDINEKIKLEIMLNLLSKSDVIVLYSILSLLDYNDYKLITEILKRTKDKIILNLTCNINEAIIGDEILIINEDKLISYDKTLNVLKEEKILKRLGLGLPFIIELNRYLMDYELIDKYYLTNAKLVGALWK